MSSYVLWQSVPSWLAGYYMLPFISLSENYAQMIDVITVV